jgi:hypothetical protein
VVLLPDLIPVPYMQCTDRRNTLCEKVYSKSIIIVVSLQTTCRWKRAWHLACMRPPRTQYPHVVLNRIGTDERRYAVAYLDLREHVVYRVVPPHWANVV